MRADGDEIPELLQGEYEFEFIGNKFKAVI